MKQESRALVRTLKEICRARKIRYRLLAEGLGVSEQTIKRFFSGEEDVSLNRLVEVCEFLGVPLAEVFELSRESLKQDFRLTEEQEELLAERKGLYALYTLLRAGEKPSGISARYGVDKHLMFKSLRRLEKAKLLDIGKEDQVRLKHRGLFSWLMKGPLQRTYLLRNDVRFVQKMIQQVITLKTPDDEFINSSEYSISEETRKQFIAELRALTRTLQRRADRDQVTLPPEELRPTKWVICLGTNPNSAAEMLKDLA